MDGHQKPSVTREFRVRGTPPEKGRFGVGPCRPTGQDYPARASTAARTRRARPELVRETGVRTGPARSSSVPVWNQQLEMPSQVEEVL